MSDIVYNVAKELNLSPAVSFDIEQSVKQDVAELNEILNNNDYLVDILHYIRNEIKPNIIQHIKKYNFPITQMTIKLTHTQLLNQYTHATICSCVKIVFDKYRALGFEIMATATTNEDEHNNITEIYINIKHMDKNMPPSYIDSQENTQHVDDKLKSQESSV